MIETEPVWGGRVAAACGRGTGWSGGADDWNLTLTGDLNSDNQTTPPPTPQSRFGSQPLAAGTPQQTSMVATTSLPSTLS